MSALGLLAQHGMLVRFARTATCADADLPSRVTTVHTWISRSWISVQDVDAAIRYLRDSMRQFVRMRIRSLLQSPFMRVWIDSPCTIASRLEVAEVQARLRGTRRYDEDATQIIVRPGLAKDEYSMIALRGNSSNGLQRFLFCRLAETEEGSALVGEIRPRTWARGFLTFALGLWFLFFVISVTATLVTVSRSQSLGGIYPRVHEFLHDHHRDE